MLGITPAFDIRQVMPSCPPEAITIGAHCIASIDDSFFLVVEVEAKVPGVEIDPVFFIRLTCDQAERLMNCGVNLCQISDVEPTPAPGTDVEFKCVVLLNGQAFRVFDIENSEDVSVLVRSRLCPVINEPFN